MVKDYHKIISEKKKVLVDFWAPWCGPCVAIKPIIKELKKELKDITIEECNVDKNIMFASHYNIKSIPTFIYFKDGEVSDIIIGSTTKKDLLKLIER